MRCACGWVDGWPLSWAIRWNRRRRGNIPSGGAKSAQRTTNSSTSPADFDWKKERNKKKRSIDRTARMRRGKGNQNHSIKSNLLRESINRALALLELCKYTKTTSAKFSFLQKMEKERFWRKKEGKENGLSSTCHLQKETGGVSATRTFFSFFSKRHKHTHQ